MNCWVPILSSGLAIVLAASVAAGQEKKKTVQVGAEVPWISYHAVDGVTNGQKMASRKSTEIANEAVKRSCVKLAKVGQGVQWQAVQTANAIVIRACVPDAPEGGGAAYSVSLSVNGKFRQKLMITSRHTWLYGKEPNPQSNSPDKGGGHLFFDEAHAMLDGSSLERGDSVRVYIDKGDTAPWCVLDLIDLETVAAPLSLPAGFLSVLDFGAVPDDGKDDSAALKACVDKARAEGKGVWLPPGTFHQTEPLLVTQGKLRGAGPWHTRLLALGLPKPKHFPGNVGIRLAGSDIEVSDLAIEGSLSSRAGLQQHGLSSSNVPSAPDKFRVENVWVEHTNTGGWLGPCSNGVIRRCRFRNTYSDGLNINQNCHDVLIEHNHWRGNGDDGIAIFSATDHKGTEGPDRDIIVRHNTVEGTWWGNGVAVYGGTGILVERNLIAGVNRGAGLLLSTGFKSWPGDEIRVLDNVLLDCGGHSQNQQWAALQTYVPGKDLKGVVIRGNTIRRASSDAFKIQGLKQSKGVLELTFADNFLDAPAANGIRILDTAHGSLTLRSNRFASIVGKNAPLANSAPPDRFGVRQTK